MPPLTSTLSLLISSPLTPLHPSLLQSPYIIFLCRMCTQGNSEDHTNGRKRYQIIMPCAPTPIPSLIQNKQRLTLSMWYALYYPILKHMYTYACQYISYWFILNHCLFNSKYTYPPFVFQLIQNTCALSLLFSVQKTCLVPNFPPSLNYTA